MIIKGTKAESLVIRWVQGAATKDKTRPMLTGINVADGSIVACDGFRLHAAKKPECWDVEGTVKGKVPSGDFVADLETIECKYPDFHQVMPTGEVVFSIGVNAKYLKEALAGMDPAQPTILRFFTASGAFEIFGKDKKENDLYALVMPMYIREQKLEQGGWRPTKPNAEMLERVKGKIEDLEDQIATDAFTAGGTEEEEAT